MKAFLLRLNLVIAAVYLRLLQAVCWLLVALAVVHCLSERMMLPAARLLLLLLGRLRSPPAPHPHTHDVPMTSTITTRALRLAGGARA